MDANPGGSGQRPSAFPVERKSGETYILRGEKVCRRWETVENGSDEVLGKAIRRAFPRPVVVTYQRR